MRIPGRGTLCDHIDVVDVSNSTRASERGEIEWMCPVCGQEYLHTDEVDVDELIKGILADLCEEDPDEKVRAVNLNIDGSWEHVSADPEKRLPMQRKKRPRLTLAQATNIAGLGNPGEIDLVEDSESEAGSVVDLDSD